MHPPSIRPLREAFRRSRVDRFGNTTRGRWLVACAIVVLGAACLAPTLPLPPPAQPVITPPDAMGIITVTGDGVIGGATVFLYNETTGSGVIETADVMGAYSMRLSASTGDGLLLWQEHRGQRGEPLDLVVP